MSSPEVLSSQFERRPEIAFSNEKVVPKFDAILVHGYWMSEHKTGLSLRSRLAARAAALAWDNGNGARKVVVDLGHQWGKDNPSEGSLIAKELMDKYQVPSDAIILREKAYSTFGEVKTVLEEAKKNGWTNILDVAFSPHHITIPKIYRQYGDEKINVTMKSVEDILEEDPNPHMRRLLKDFASSRYNFTYKTYERIKWLLMHRPGFNYESLEKSNKKRRKGKGKDSQLPGPLRIDVYTLNGKKS